MISIEYLRQFRIFNYALFDLIVSFLGMLVLSPLLSKIFLKIKVKIPKLNWVILTLPIGLSVHLLTGNLTPMTKNFLDLNGHYFLKFIIFGFLYFGLRNIKLIKK